MPLSDDQRALLRLLAQREEGYDDIAALMGVSVGEVRSRVKDALEGLEQGARDEEPPAAGPVAAGDPPPPAVAEASSGAVPPAAPPAAETPPSPRATDRPYQPKPRRHSSPLRSPLASGRRRLWEVVGGAVVVLLLVLFATGAIDIGGDDGGSDGSDPGAATPVASGSSNITQAALEPVDGGDASGRALFGRLQKNVVLQVLAEGLEPTAAGETYTVWLYRSPKLALRIGAVKVGEAGELAARFAIPPEVLALVANGAFGQIDVSRTSVSAYKTEVAEAKRQQRLPRYTGESVLRGEIAGPLAEAESPGG